MQSALAGNLAPAYSRAASTNGQFERGSQEMRLQENAFAPEQCKPLGLECRRLHRPQPWLPAALAELRECKDEAREERYPEPAEKALNVAEAILKRIARLPFALPEPSVYPSADHEIVLFFRRQDARAAVSLSVDADGGGAWFSNVRGHRRARYDDVSAFPDDFLSCELAKLASMAHAD